MKKGVIIFLHLGYWLLYLLLLLLIHSLVFAGLKKANELPARIGIDLKQQETGLRIESLAKNGPADKQGDLEPGDLILKLKETSGDTVDVSKLSVINSSRFFHGEEGSLLLLVVKKTDGTTKFISIKREKIEQNYGPAIRNWSMLMLGIAVVPGAIAFYCFYTFLFTHFLSRRKILLLIITGILVSMFTAIPGEAILYFVMPEENWILNVFVGIGVIISINALLNGVMGLVMRGFISWYGDIKLKEDLNKKNYETELALVKSQLNPHFLFNTINNIDVLIMKDPSMASDYLNKLSDIMRFMLYETKSEKIALTKELEYIEKYIELQKIRTANPDFIHYELKGSAHNIFIDAMLFIPFIENAFKHSENKKIENAIRISIEIKGHTIYFECQNHYAASPQLEPEYGGLGQSLIKKRLELLYPQAHELKIDKQDQIYLVKLILRTA